MSEEKEGYEYNERDEPMIIAPSPVPMFPGCLDIYEELNIQECERLFDAAAEEIWNE